MTFSFARFAGDKTDFSKAAFPSTRTDFTNSYLSSRATTFELAAFESQYVSFDGVQFGSEDRRTSDDFPWVDSGVRFARTLFGQQTKTNMKHSWFMGKVDFSLAIFAGAISFEMPRAWDDVIFDWNDSPADLPNTVRPRDWPPKVGAMRFDFGAAATPSPPAT